MTSEQIKFIIHDIYNETLSNDNIVEYTPLLNNKMIIITKETNLYTDKERYRYRFDFNNRVLEQIMVRRTSTLSLHMRGEVGEYDNDHNPIFYYEYIKDKDGIILTNYFDFDKIIMFVPDTSKINTVSVANAYAQNSLGGGN